MPSVMIKCQKQKNVDTSTF